MTKIQNSKVYAALLELEDSNNNCPDYEIGGRGGHYGLSAEQALELIGAPADLESYLPGHFGAYCNYLGGGLRGAIALSNFDGKIPAKWAAKLKQLGEACARRYEELEGSMNDEIDEDGDPNWDAIGTNKSRRAGVVSAY